jgi:hypothetical protein
VWPPGQGGSKGLDCREVRRHFPDDLLSNTFRHYPNDQEPEKRQHRKPDNNPSQWILLIAVVSKEIP